MEKARLEVGVQKTKSAYRVENARLAVCSTVKIVTFNVKSPRAQLRGELVTKMVKNRASTLKDSARLAKLSPLQGQEPVGSTEESERW